MIHNLTRLLFWCILQNVGGGTSVVRVMATDRDIGPNAMLFYYLTAGNQDLTFRMDRVTGEMVTRPSPPDRERQAEYRLTVTVEDDGTPPLSVGHSSKHGITTCCKHVLLISIPTVFSFSYSQITESIESEFIRIINK